MVLLYGLLRAFAAAIRAIASWGHSSAKRRYEQLETSFRELESQCKAGEVRVGRPMDYAAQLKLLKQFERREQARLRWVARARRLQRREAWEKRVRDFSGRKLPYSFGVIDMALALKLAEVAGLSATNLAQWLSALL